MIDRISDRKLYKAAALAGLLSGVDNLGPDQPSWRFLVGVCGAIADEMMLEDYDDEMMLEDYYDEGV